MMHAAKIVRRAARFGRSVVRFRVSSPLAAAAGGACGSVRRSYLSLAHFQCDLSVQRRGRETHTILVAGAQPIPIRGKLILQVVELIEDHNDAWYQPAIERHETEQRRRVEIAIEMDDQLATRFKSREKSIEPIVKQSCHEVTALIVDLRDRGGKRPRWLIVRPIFR